MSIGTGVGAVVGLGETVGVGLTIGVGDGDAPTAFRVQESGTVVPAPDTNVIVVAPGAVAASGSAQVGPSAVIVSIANGKTSWCWTFAGPQQGIVQFQQP